MSFILYSIMHLLLARFRIFFNYYSFFPVFQLSKAYFAYVEVLFSNHIAFILNLDSSTFMHIASSLESGLKGLDAGIASQVMSLFTSWCLLKFGD